MGRAVYSLPQEYGKCLIQKNNAVLQGGHTRGPDDLREFFLVKYSERILIHGYFCIDIPTVAFRAADNDR